MIVILAVVVSAFVAAALSFTPFAKSDYWRATVTPLASIIGSGFLVCAPLLAHEFGILAAPAMGVLLAIAYAVGAVMRSNILHVEPYLASAERSAMIAWIARFAQASLSMAYAVSVAYYLKLLAEFLLRGMHTHSAYLSNWIVTGIIVFVAVLPLIGGVQKVEHLAHATVSIKLGIIAGLLVALLASWILRGGSPLVYPPAKVSSNNLLVLLGLLITVQGFETSRYLGGSYDAQTRIRTMKLAQWVSSATYLAFLILLTPFLGEAANTKGVAGILDIMKSIAPLLAILVLVGAVTSQISAAVADSIGSAGILVEITKQRIKLATGFGAA